MQNRAGTARSAKELARRILGWPVRRLLDRRIEWVLGSVNYRQDRLEDRVQAVADLLGEAVLDRRLARLAAADELVLPIDTARFLNWAEGLEGPAARAGLWFNTPVPVRYEQNAVEVLLVNERIVEQPYVFGALSGLRPPARILDVGGSESTIALSLACLGHDVHVVDPRGYPLRHPRLRQSPVTLDELRAELRFDAAIAVSSIEHFGLGAYGGHARGLAADQAALATVRERLAPGGLFVLTVPCATEPSVDEFQRVYSFEQLREMLAAWEILDLSVVWQQDRHTWIRGTPEDPQAASGVALVTVSNVR
jgi:Caenorhabditis protein of unknown function, DUF268